MKGLDDIQRREFLAATAKTCFGVSLSSSWFSSAEASNLIAQAGSKGKARHVIYLYMAGGMSHIDTLDPKPDAPSEYRGPVRSISTKVAGIQLGEHFQKTAKHTDKMAIVRSMNSTQGAHEQGNYHVHTGYTTRASTKHPSLGSWASRLDPTRLKGTLPPFVTVHTGNRHPAEGFFEPSLAPLPIGDATQGLQNSRRHKSTSEAAFNRQLALRTRLDADFMQKFGKGQKNVRAYNEIFQSAVHLMKSKDLEAFDLSRESKEVHQLYGNDKFAKGVLLARRLVEHGVRFIEVELGGFDWHSDNFRQADEKLPLLDQVYAALLHDLEVRGLLDSTAGRNHFPKAFSFALAGAGIKGGTVYGETDARAENILGEKTSVADFNSTIASAMGLPHDQMIFSPAKRPFKMGGKSGQPIKEILT